MTVGISRYFGIRKIHPDLSLVFPSVFQSDFSFLFYFSLGSCKVFFYIRNRLITSLYSRSLTVCFTRFLL